MSSLFRSRRHRPPARRNEVLPRSLPERHHTVINQNNLAREISLREGLRKEVNIAQIKEVLKHTLNILANHHQMWEVVQLIESRKLQVENPAKPPRARKKTA
jgi:hypothetical protein